MDRSNAQHPVYTGPWVLKRRLGETSWVLWTGMRYFTGHTSCVGRPFFSNLFFVFFSQNANELPKSDVFFLKGRCFSFVEEQIFFKRNRIRGLVWSLLIVDLCRSSVVQKRDLVRRRAHTCERLKPSSECDIAPCIPPPLIDTPYPQLTPPLIDTPRGFWGRWGVSIGRGVRGGVCSPQNPD